MRTMNRILAAPFRKGGCLPSGDGSPLLTAVLLMAVFGGVACRKPPAVNPYNSVVERLRLFQEIVPLQAHRNELEAKAFSTAGPDPVLWGGYNQAAISLVEESNNLCRHLAEDLKNLEKGGSTPAQAAAFRMFAKESSSFADSVRKSVNKLAFIVSHLFGMTRAPNSWTKKEYENSVKGYQNACKEMNRRAKVFTAALDNLKKFQRSASKPRARGS